MPQDEIVRIATDLSYYQPSDNPLFQDDPVLWRIFALLEMLRILPNPQELHSYEQVVRMNNDPDAVFDTLLRIETCRDIANDLAYRVESTYSTISDTTNEQRAAVIRVAAESLANNADTNILRVVEALRDIGSIDTRELNQTACIVGYLIDTPAATENWYT